MKNNPRLSSDTRLFVSGTNVVRRAVISISPVEKAIIKKNIGTTNRIRQLTRTGSSVAIAIMMAISAGGRLSYTFRSDLDSGTAIAGKPKLVMMFFEPWRRPAPERRPCVMKPKNVTPIIKNPTKLLIPRSVFKTMPKMRMYNRDCSTGLRIIHTLPRNVSRPELSARLFASTPMKVRRAQMRAM